MSEAVIDVRYVADLARLQLSEEEVATFQGQLDAILEMMEKLKSLPCEGIEPTLYAMPVYDRMRADVAGESLPRELVLENAPDQAQQQIRVPKVIAEA